MSDLPPGEDLEVLQRENAALRLRVAELQRGAASHAETGNALVEREELLRDAERVAHLGTWTWDFASGHVTWSDELFRILCDVAMAHMRGPELVERMRASGVAPRVLFITGYSEEAAHDELAHAVLAKPFTTRALLDAIAGVIEGVKRRGGE